MDLDGRVEAFAQEVGDGDPIGVEGHGSRRIRRDRTPYRAVRAPSGIVEFHPDEMTVSCGAGTPLVELNAALGRHRQFAALPFGESGSEHGTVGGALAVGRSRIDRLGVGPVRDALLAATFVDHRGRIVRAGGPTVKNVSGFDVCRVLVGSYGRLGFLARVTLRTRPEPPSVSWWSTPADAERTRRLLTGLYRPGAILWDGQQAWVNLRGHPDDTRAQALRHGLVEIECAPTIPTGHRLSVRPAEVFAAVTTAGGRVVAEVGVGIVHTDQSPPPVGGEPDPISQRLLDEFDPRRRLNPQVPFPQ